jgi:uncharacterized coiled-coil DUF342 family protein
MKKNTRHQKNLIQTGIQVGAGVVAVSSIALALHFNSLAEESKDSHIKLNAKYQEVLVENEELRDTNIQLNDEVIVLKDAAEKSSGLLEQSQQEIERLNTENDNLQGKIKDFQGKVAELEKKLDSTP